jgi:hypothetical protein
MYKVKENQFRKTLLWQWNSSVGQLSRKLTSNIRSKIYCWSQIEM